MNKDEMWKCEKRKGKQRVGRIVCRLLFRYFILPHFLIYPTACAPYTQTEVDLTEQTKKGLSILRAAQADHVALAGRVNELQRQRLDDAFDADVREAPDISADWVIEHRKAYVIGVDALNTQRAASTNAAATATRNLEAIEQSLNQLQRLQRARLRLEQNFNLEKDK